MCDTGRINSLLRFFFSYLPIIHNKVIVRSLFPFLIWSIPAFCSTEVISGQPMAATSVTSGSSSHLRIGLLRGIPAKWDLDANYNVFLDMLKIAVGERVDVFITPECWLDGYAAPDPVSTPEKLRGIAQDLRTSSYLSQVAEEAKKNRMYICFGFSSIEDGKLFNSAGLWDREGQLLGVYHKTHLQTHDLQYSYGESLPVFPTEYGPLGIMICADRRWPETARVLRLQGAKLILNPTYGMCGESNEMWMRTRGYENQCFIAFTHPKVSLVVNPDGKVAAKSDEPGPAVLTCDIDLSEATEDNHLKDRRPELYQILSVPSSELPIYKR